MEELRGYFRKRRPRLIVLVARGTSDNAAQFGRYLIEITTRIPVSLAAPSILTLYESPLDLRDVLVVGISQSGESTDTNAVLADARERGATTVGITNEPGSAMAKLVEFPLLIQAGGGEQRSGDQDLHLPATHAIPARLCAFRRRRSWTICGAFPSGWSGVLRLEEDIEDLAERYFFMTRAVTVGRGLNYANALEFGLKLMETCYVVTERFSAADLMHGPIALVERAFPGLRVRARRASPGRPFPPCSIACGSSKPKR